jgi:S-adenosylmethionine hydrolase
VAVIDPGVGSSRRLVYAEIGGQHYVAPDNGLLTLVARRSCPTRLIELAEARYWSNNVSNTFHGRDILAPVAAHLSLGVAPQQLGPAIENLFMLSIPEPQVAADRILGHVLLADSFGNLITNIHRDQVQQLGPPEQLRVACQEWNASGIRRTYSEDRPGETIALFDSQGRLEIAVVQESAARLIGAELGTSVVVSRG